jgi:hypothetical protein
MLAPKPASRWGWPNHQGLIGGLGGERHTLSMQDASMRSQPGLEEQSALHFAQAMRSVMPFSWSVVGNRCVFWGGDFRQGRALPCRPNALILMGDWCGLPDKSDTAETKTRVRRHQRACGKNERQTGALTRAMNCCASLTGGG